MNATDFHNHGRWVQPPLSGTFWCRWSESWAVRELSRGLRPLVFLDGHSLTPRSDDAVFSRLLSRNRSGRRAASLAKKIDAIGRRLERAHLAVLKTSQEPAARLPALFQTYADVVGLWWFCIPLGQVIEAELRRRYPKLSSDDIFSAGKPVRQTWLEREAEAVRRIAALPKSKWKTAATKHAQHYAWIGTHHWGGKPYLVARCLQNVRAAAKRGAVEHAKKPRVIDPGLLQLARTVSYWRTHSAELTAKVVFDCRGALTEQAKRWKLSYDDLCQLTHREIEVNLGRPGLPAALKKQISARRRAYGCVVGAAGRERVYVGRAYDRMQKRLVPSEKVSGAEIHGTVASSGAPVTARACVVLGPKQFRDFRRGDVLVTNETTPDFVMLMKHASAVVTDIGGMTSHAAVVCRELGKPCVVSTRVATQAIKTGDRVTVDSVSGTVTILKS